MLLDQRCRFLSFVRESPSKTRQFWIWPTFCISRAVLIVHAAPRSSRRQVSGSVHRVLPILVGACLAVLWAGPAAAQTKLATLAWDANTDPLTAGYQVLVGTAPGTTAVTLDVGRATSTSLPLPLGGRYFLSVRGYAADGSPGPTSVETIVDLTGRPVSPSRMTASVNGTLADVSWAPPLTGPAPLSYLLTVGTFPGGSNLLNALPVGGGSSIGGPLPPGTYYARVQAANLMGVGPASSEVMFQVGGGSAPASPTGLGVSWSGTTAHLSWTPPAGAAPTSYVVEAGTASGLTDSGAVNVGAATSFAVNLPSGAYFVRVRALNANGASAPSNEVLVQRAVVALPGPIPLLDAELSGSTLVLDWRAPTTGGPVEDYVLEAGSAPGLSNLVTLPLGTSRLFSVTVPPGAYYIRVRARNSGGLGAPSREFLIRR